MTDSGRMGETISNPLASIVTFSGVKSDDGVSIDDDVVVVVVGVLWELLYAVEEARTLNRNAELLSDISVGSLAWWEWVLGVSSSGMAVLLALDMTSLAMAMDASSSMVGILVILELLVRRGDSREQRGILLNFTKKLTEFCRNALQN